MKTVLITGANKGIGFEAARQLLQKGFHVILGARDEAKGRLAAKDLGPMDGKITFLRLDVSDKASVRSAADHFSEVADKLDVLVNNAGIIYEGDVDILKMDASLLERTWSTNALGALRVTQAFLPFLEKSQSPRVINVSSGGGQLDGGADGWAPAYCISKTALNGITSQLAKALPRFAVNSVCPGWVRTDMGGAGAPRSVEQGADTIVWLADEAPPTLSGKFLRDRAEIPW